MMTPELKDALLKNELIIFASDFGKKGVTETWTQRYKKQVKQVDQFKEFSNYNIATGGDSLIADIDLDCPEAIKLADAFLTPTAMEFGRESAGGRSHRLYKVIDLNKKTTRKFFSFEDSDADKEVLLEFRANKFYTMCLGQYDDGEKAIWNIYKTPTETTEDALYKSAALLGVASIILRKYPNAGNRNEYIKLVIGTLWYHKVEEADVYKIIEACAVAADDDVNERLARVKSIYAMEPNAQILGLPELAKVFDFTDKQVKDFKKVLYAVTGRSALPEYTHTFVDRIAYMMKQKKYYDLEDKEMYEGESIDVKYSKYFKNYTPLKFWKMHPDSKVCVDFAYKPADKNRFIKVNKKLMINVYEPHDIKPDPNADTDLFDALVKHLIPHEVYRNHFLDWFAFPLQNPGIKIRHAIILQSDVFQIGKGSLFDIHRDLLGMHNTSKIDLEQAINREKNFLVDKQTVLIDEAKAKGSWSEKSQFINTLKTLITEGTSGVRALYQGYKEQETCTNYWINTNYRDAFPLPHNEERYWVYFIETLRNARLLKEFHAERLEGDLVAGVMAQLLDRDLSKFDYMGVAPHTPYRDMMHTLADKPVNDYIKESFEQGVYPFDRDLISTTEMFSWLKEKSRAVRVTREREIAEAFKSIGGIIKKNCPVKGVGSFVSVWILRNHDQYKNLSAAELGKKYVGFHTENETAIVK